MQASHALLTFTELTIGGPILGIIIGMITLWVLKRIHFDSTSDITITLVACYGVFIIAEGMLPFQVSGILAVVSLGLMLSSSGRAVVADHHHVHEFWEIIEYFGTWTSGACACVHVTVAACEYRADVNAPHAPIRVHDAANTIIFILAGVVIVEQGFTERINAWDWVYLLLLYVAIHIIRGFAVLLLSPMLAHLGYGMTWKEMVVLTYSGLRGAVGLALALLLRIDPKVSTGTPRLRIAACVCSVTLTPTPCACSDLREVPRHGQLVRVPHGRYRCADAAGQCFHNRAAGGEAGCCLCIER